MGIKVTLAGTTTSIVRPVEFEDALRSRSRMVRTMKAHRVYHLRNCQVMLVANV